MVLLLSAWINGAAKNVFVLKKLITPHTSTRLPKFSPNKKTEKLNINLNMMLLPNSCFFLTILNSKINPVLKLICDNECVIFKCS